MIIGLEWQQDSDTQVSSNPQTIAYVSPSKERIVMPEVQFIAKADSFHDGKWYPSIIGVCGCRNAFCSSLRAMDTKEDALQAAIDEVEDAICGIHEDGFVTHWKLNGWARQIGLLLGIIRA